MLSMTGFGSAARETPFGRLSVELRSVNNRFLDITPRLGSILSVFEGAVRAELRRRLQRGKVDIIARFTPNEDFAPPGRVNGALLKSLVEQVRAIFPDGDAPRVEAFLAVPGVVAVSAEPEAGKQLEAELMAVLGEALDSLIAERRREGESLRQSLSEQRRRMSTLRQEIAGSRDAVVAKYRERLHARLAELLGPQAASLDPGRLEQEVAIFTDKADVTEECERLSGHLDALEALLEKSGEAAGRSLEFLAQEILREVNTIGSKCRDLEIARRVLDLKNETETLRELLANVE